MARNITNTPAITDAVTAMTTAVKLCNTLRDAGKPYKEDGGAYAQAEEAVKTANKEIVKAAVKELLSIAQTSRLDMFTSYLEDWTVEGYKLTDGEISVTADPKELRVTFSAMDSAFTDPDNPKVKLATRGNWAAMLKVFEDNCVQNWASKENGGGVDLLPLPANLVKEREKFGEKWVTKEGKPAIGKKALVEQMTDLVAAILPEELACKMQDADVRNFQTAILAYKRKAGMGAMTYSIANVKTAEDILFDAINQRRNQYAVKLEDSLKREDAKSQPVGEGEKPAKLTAKDTTVKTVKTEKTDKTAA